MSRKFNPIIQAALTTAAALLSDREALRDEPERYRCDPVPQAKPKRKAKAKKKARRRGA